MKKMLTDLKCSMVDGKPLTESVLQFLFLLALFVLFVILLIVIGGGRHVATSSVRFTTPLVAEVKLEAHPVIVASAERPGLSMVLTTETAPALKEPEKVVHLVRSGETLIGLLRAYCRDDYLAVARENGIDPNWIYAGKTVLQFNNGCTQAPQVLVKQNVSPRELVRNDKASSGKRIPSLAVRDTEARSLSITPVLASQVSALQSAPVTVRTVVDASVPLSELHHSEIYRIVALRKMGDRTKAQNAELTQLTTRIRAAVLSRYQLPHPDCLYAKDMGKHRDEQVLARIRCIRQNYGPVITEVAKERGLPAAYLEAVIFVESGGKPDAISSTGCTGLKQFTLRSAKLFGLSDRFDPFESIRAAGRHLESNLRQWRGDVAKATAHYNVGAVMVGTGGFNAATFPYTESVLRVQSLIEREFPRLSYNRH